MLIDSSELGRLTNPFFVEVVREAIGGVRMSEKPLVTLKDLLPYPTVHGLNYKPVEGDTVMSVSDLDRITLRSLGAEERIQLKGLSVGRIKDVHCLKDKNPLAFTIVLLDGTEVPISENINAYIPISVLGKLVNNKLELNPNLLQGLKRTLTPQEIEIQEAKLLKLRGFFKSPTVFSRIRDHREIEVNHWTLEKAEDAYVGIEGLIISSILGDCKPINITHLNPGQAVAYMTDEGDNREIMFKEFRGVTGPNNVKGYIVYGSADDRLPMNSRRVLRLRAQPLLIPYGDANLYLGRGQVYDSYNAMTARYDKLAGDVMKVNMEIKKLFAQHLGVSLEEA